MTLEQTAVLGLRSISGSLFSQYTDDYFIRRAKDERLAPADKLGKHVRGQSISICLVVGIEFIAGTKRIDLFVGEDVYVARRVSGMLKLD